MKKETEWAAHESASLEVKALRLAADLKLDNKKNSEILKVIAEFGYTEGYSAGILQERNYLYGVGKLAVLGGIGNVKADGMPNPKEVPYISFSRLEEPQKPDTLLKEGAQYSCTTQIIFYSPESIDNLIVQLQVIKENFYEQIAKEKKDS